MLPEEQNKNENEGSTNNTPQAPQVFVGGDETFDPSIPVKQEIKTSSRKKPLLIVGTLIVVILALTGGYFVYSQNKNNTSNASSVARNASKSNAANASKQETTVDPTASWKSFTNTLGSYSLRYPPSWLIAGCGDTPESSVMVLLSNNSDYLGKCPDFSHRPRQVQVGFDKSSTANPDFSPTPGLEISDATVGGVKAKKYVTTYDNPSNGEVKNINYRLYTNGENFTISYTIYKNPNTGTLIDDNLNDFTTMVEKTLKFQ